MSAVEPNQQPESGREQPDEYPTISEPGFETGQYPTLHEPPAPFEFEPPRGPRAALGRFDPVSVGAGLVFFLIGGAYVLASGGHVTVNAGWTLSLLLLGLGLSGVVGGLVGQSRRRRWEARQNSRAGR